MPRTPVIGRARPSPNVLAKPTMKPDSKATVASAERATIKQLKDDLRALLDQADPVIETGADGSDAVVELQRTMDELRRRWGLS